MSASEVEAVDASMLAPFPLFERLGPEALDSLAEIAELVSVASGEVIFREGQASDALYLIFDGRLRLSVKEPGRKDTALLTLSAGELCGFSALLGRNRIATGVASVPSRVIRLDGSRLLELCEADPRIGYVIMSQAFEELADRLHDTRLQMLDFFGKKELA